MSKERGKERLEVEIIGVLFWGLCHLGCLSRSGEIPWIIGGAKEIGMAEMLLQLFLSFSHTLLDAERWWRGREACERICADMGVTLRPRMIFMKEKARRFVSLEKSSGRSVKNLTHASLMSTMMRRTPTRYPHIVSHWGGFPTNEIRWEFIRLYFSRRCLTNPLKTSHSDVRINIP